LGGQGTSRSIRMTCCLTFRCPAFMVFR